MPNHTDIKFLAPITAGKKIQNLQKSVFNAANLNGMGAIALSWELGTHIGSLLFAVAMIWGIVNKYRSLGATADTKKNAILAYLTDPSITAQILMLAAGYNCTLMIVRIVSGVPDAAQNIWLAFAWFFGFLGDNALRKLDSINFSHFVKAETLRSRLKLAGKILIANPAIFYNPTGLCFTSAMMQNYVLTSLQGLMGLAIIAVCIAGILYSIFKVYWTVNNLENIENINDGFLNYSSATENFGQCILALATDHYYVAFAQVIFTVSCVKLLFETRSAVHKKYNTQSLAEVS